MTRDEHYSSYMNRRMDKAAHLRYGLEWTGLFVEERAFDEGAKWWDNYAQEEIIILDEFYGWLPYCEMLRLLDRYPCQVETKGGSINFAPNKIT